MALSILHFFKILPAVLEIKSPGSLKSPLYRRGDADIALSFLMLV